MKSRAEVVRFIKKQLSPHYKVSFEKPNCWHYGKQELRELMDFIYGQEPQSKDEEM
jgi:hypothetical protein